MSFQDQLVSREQGEDVGVRAVGGDTEEVTLDLPLLQIYIGWCGAGQQRVMVCDAVLTQTLPSGSVEVWN